MRCKDCDCAKKGYFQSRPDAYVCIGVKEPFVIEDYPNAECTQYKHTIDSNGAMNDGLYMELFIFQNGVKYNIKTINMKDVTTTLTNALMDGVQKLWETK